jgi:hypothetical protein
MYNTEISSRKIEKIQDPYNLFKAGCEMQDYTIDKSKHFFLLDTKLQDHNYSSMLVFKYCPKIFI